MKPKKRKQILEVTETLFNRFGIRRTGVDEIAKLADVAKGTIYNYFESKEGLFRALMLEKLAIFEEMLDRSVTTIQDPVARIKAAALGHLRVSIDNPFLSDKLLYGNYDEKIRSFLSELEQKTEKAVEKILKGIDSKKMAASDKKALSRTILFALKGMTETVRERLGPVSLRTFEKEIDYMVKALLTTEKQS